MVTSPTTLLRQQAKRIQLRARVTFSRPTRFLIVSNGRSGSNLLLSLLSSHPRVKHCGEYFTDNRMKTENFDGRDLLREFKDELRRKGFEKAVGAKFLYYQLEPSYARHFQCPQLRDVQRYVLNERRFRIVHLTRRNVFRTVLSMMIAAKTKVYRAHQPKDLKQDVAIEIDPQVCLQKMRAVREGEARARRLFSGHRVFELVYEDLVSEQTAQTDRLLRFLGVDPMPLVGRLIKQGRNPRDSIKNFDQLAEAFSGTEWEPMLADS